MSKAVTPDEVKEFHRLYEQYGSYAEVARRTGRSASTIPILRGITYGDILKLARLALNCIDRRPNRQTLRTWKEPCYSISLLFDAQNLCLGREEEISK